MEKNKRKKEIPKERVKTGEEECYQHSVKSRAVVKYSTVETPAHFAQLECNTDLKLPPSNWLFSSTKNYGLHHPVLKSNGFTSFRLAHMYSDCIGEVDVVSDAENIKQLLKIPYNKAPVSMMIHRIENTLLIDEFDIHKHLLIQAENDWQWLRKFFFENVIPRHDFSLGHRHTRSKLQQKSLVSKFLHYSFGEKDGQLLGGTGLEPFTVNENYPCDLIPTSVGPALPEPEVSEGLPDSASDYKFIRNVVWSFEDIQMLLGTDMPIFGGSTHPCISLRLRDIEKPISVLTGIDYWLDNLMSNVPEVIMCYHLDGIVQKYEMIKTEDLPHLTDAKFSPELIRDVAQNILSFLKSNATKAGHTYWLFKGRNDDVVKLYDLSSICSESLVDKEQNPFTVPVGLLFYRVARNMKQSKDHTQPATLRMLLENCLALLYKEKYPQIVTSAHYMLADIYIPVDTNPNSPNLLDETTADPEQSGDDPDDEITRTQVPVKALCIANYITDRESKYQPPPLSGNIAERCNSALSHVAQGLDCLQYFTHIGRNNKNEDKEEVKMAKSSEPIPMPYSKLHPDDSSSEDTAPSQNNTASKNKSANALLCKAKSEPIPTWHSPNKMDNMSWKIHLEALLVKKACLVYRTLVEHQFSSARYRRCLLSIDKYVNLIRTGPVEIFDVTEMAAMQKRAGDCCFHLVKNRSNADANTCDTDPDTPSLVHFFSASRQRAGDADLLSIPRESTDVKQMLLSSRVCYLAALKLLNRQDSDLLLRIGNIHNEIGIYLINQAYECYQKAGESSSNMTEVEKKLTEAETELNRGMKIFEKLCDSMNRSLVLTNMSKLFRLRGLQHQNSLQLYPLYNHKAEESYLEALKVLGCRKDHPQIWDAVYWEMSSFLFQQAFNIHESQLQAKSIDEVSREAIELCQKCLKYCDLTTPDSRLPLYQYRAARLHHMLASIFHRQYRDSGGLDDNRRKMILKLCQNHLNKAIDLFHSVDSSSDLVAAYLEKISLLELQASEASSGSAKVKLYRTALSVFSQLEPVLSDRLTNTPLSNGHVSNDKEGSATVSEDCDSSEEMKLLTLERMLCSVLKEIIAVSIRSKSGGEKLCQYKQAYALLLKKTSDSPLLSVLIQVVRLLPPQC